MKTNRTNRTNPVLNRPNQGQDSREFLKNLEELMRRNKGGFGAMAFDVGSNQPYRVGGRVLQPNQETPSLSWKPGTPQQSYDISQLAPQDIQQEELPPLDNELPPLDNELPETPEMLAGGNPQDPNTFAGFFSMANQSVKGLSQRSPWGDGIATIQDANGESGTLYSDGFIHYADGTMRLYTGQTASPYRTNNDGSIGYDDGSSRYPEPTILPMSAMDPKTGREIIFYSDGSKRWGGYLTKPGEQVQGGVEGLGQLLLGQSPVVTQAYGNYNPSLEPGSGYNMGIDFRTRDLQNREFKLPYDVEVVQVFQDDGTRFGDKSGHQGYGNSLLIKLATGEMVRLSHLDQMGQFKPGDVIPAGQVFGTPGSTGNATGEHLDVEYYDVSGQRTNPENFQGFAKPELLFPDQPAPNTPITEDQQSQPQQLQPPQQPQQPQIQNPVLDALTQVTEPIRQNTAQAIEQWNPTGQMGVGASELLRGDTQGAKTELANTINTLNPTGNFDLGISEKLQNQPELANQKLSNTIANLGQQTGLPETGVSEAAQTGGLTGALRQLAGNTVDTLSTPFKKVGVPDFGVSEAIAGGRTVNTGANFIPANAAENMSKEPTKRDYAGVLGQNLSNVAKELRGKAGQGIEVLKSAGSGIKNLIGQGLRTLTPRREVGEQSSQVAQEVGETAQKASMAPQNDIRDPFFKLGGAQMYSKYIAPDAETKRGGALTMDLFSPDFFSNADNVANVFGGTYMGKEATDKFRSSEASKYQPSSFTPAGYGEGAWSDDYRRQIDQYNRQGQEETEKYNKSITDYLGSIPSVLTSAFSFKDREKPSAPKISLGTVRKSNAMPNMSYATNMRPEPAPTPQKMSFTRKPKPVQTIRPDLMSVTQPQMSFARNIPQMSVAPKPVPVPVPTPPQRPAPQQPRPTLQDYLRRGKTVAQWFAETGQQSSLDSFSRQGYDPRSNTNPYNMSGKQMSVDPKQVVNQAIQAASRGYQYVSPSGNVIQNYTPANANMTDASTGLPVVANNAPYPIQQMADGRIKYSDGSIR